MKKLSLAVLGLWCALVSAAFAPLFTPPINLVSNGAAPAGNMVSPFMFGFSTTEYFAPQGSATGSLYDDTIVSTDGTLSDFYFYSDGNSYPVAIYKNGAFVANICTLSSNACSNTSLTVSVVAGDVVSYLGDNCCYTIGGSKFTASTGQHQPLSGYGQASVGSTRYVAISGLNGAATTAAEVESIIPTDGAIDQIYASAGASINGLVITLIKNGVDTSLTCTAVGSACSGTGSVSITAGDAVAIKFAPGGGSNFVRASVRWSPAIADEALVLKARPGAPATNATRYILPFAASWAALTQSTGLTVVPYAATFSKFAVTLGAAPSSTHSYTYTLMKGTAGWSTSISDTSATCTITGASTSCSTSGTATYAAGNTLSLKSVPSGTPATSVSSTVSMVVKP